MDLFLDIFVHHFFEWVVLGILGFMGWIAKKALELYKASEQHKKEKVERDCVEQAQMKLGLLALLRFRVEGLCDLIRHKGYMTMDEKLGLTDLYNAYKALGGNSRTHLIYEEVIGKYGVKNDDE